jgi:hypothetical protein
MERRNSLFSKANKKISANTESISICSLEDDADDLMFMEGEACLGKAVASFSFGAKDNSERKDVPVEVHSFSKNFTGAPLKEEKSSHVTPKGVTPPIDGEHFTLKRGYQLRPSTQRKLNELKAKHPDVNVYLNTILDAAILHYYNYIFNENGDFSS